MTWLITAYEPFGGAQTNSALIALNKISKKKWNGKIHFFSPIPVVFHEDWLLVLHEAEKTSDLKGILCLGQAEWRLKITPERLALNWIDAKIPDNQGLQIKNQKIVENAPDLLWSNIPWEKMQPNPNWETSYSAGTFLCNSLMFHVVNWCQQNNKLGGFVHFPLLKSQNDSALQTYLPRMPDEVACTNLERIIDFLLDH